MADHHEELPNSIDALVELARRELLNLELLDREANDQRRARIDWILRTIRARQAELREELVGQRDASGLRDVLRRHGLVGDWRTLRTEQRDIRAAYLYRDLVSGFGGCISPREDRRLVGAAPSGVMPGGKPYFEVDPAEVAGSRKGDVQALHQLAQWFECSPHAARERVIKGRKLLRQMLGDHLCFPPISGPTTLKVPSPAPKATWSGSACRPR